MKRLTWCFLFCGLSSFGQSFRGEASLPEVSSDGFYRIAVSPVISTHLNEEFANLRIYDKDKKEVPYIYQKEEPAYYTTQFKSYEIVSKTQQKNCCTTLVLRNPDGRAINNLSLSIKNAEVTKGASLLGSDNQQDWFALKQHFTLSAINSRRSTSEVRIIDFPLSNYTYYQLQIEDSTTAPLNILGAGYYEVTSEDGKYNSLDTKRIVKSDSAREKRSYVRLLFDTTLVVDKIMLQMTGAPYFRRTATLLSPYRTTDRHGKESIYYEALSTFELSSKQPSVIELAGLHAQELLVRIENADNPVLELGTFKAYQLNRYFTAWLKKGNRYTIKIGDTDMPAPHYDLAFFRDNIPDQPVVLAISNIKIFDAPKDKGSPTFFTNTIIIWVAIAAVIAILGFMAVKMVNETSKR